MEGWRGVGFGLHGVVGSVYRCRFCMGIHSFRGGTARTGRLQLRPRIVPPLCHRLLSHALSQASSRISRHQDDCYVAGANDFRNIEGGRRSSKLDRKLQHPSTLGMVGNRKVTTRIGKSPTINTAGADVRRREKNPVQRACTAAAYGIPHATTGLVCA